MIRIRVLGPLEVESGGDLVELPGRRDRALLTILAMNPEWSVSVESLSEHLWDGEPPRTARKSIQTAVANIRRLLSRPGLDPGWLATTETGYRLSCRDVDVDLVSFDRLAADGAARLRDGEPHLAVAPLSDACTLWRADDPAAMGDGPAAVAEASRLVERRLDVLADRIAAQLGCGGAGELVAELSGLCERWPVHERFHEQLMLALYRAGRQPDSLSVADTLRRRLMDQHGLEPSSSVVDLERRILDQHEDLLVARAPSPPDIGVGAPPQIPRPVQTLIGREDELAELEAGLVASSLVTVTGPGGVGKTALATELASRVDPSTEVVWCSLGDISDGSSVLPALATAAAVRPQAGVSLADAIAQRLGVGEMFLVMDNCEHVLAPAAEAVRHLRTAAEGLQIVATSRSPLGLPDEWVFPVDGLVTPDVGAAPSAPAIELFIHRATSSDARLELDENLLAVVAQICRGLDGNPLAIELAAGRARGLPPHLLAARLDSRLELLVGRRPGVDERHQSLRAAITWSHELLTEDERKVFRRLGTLAGSFDLDDATAVASLDDVDPGEVPRLVADLVDRSMVQSDPTDAMSGYRLLESMKVYARHELAREGEDEIAHATFVRHVSERLREEGRGITGPDEGSAAAWVRSSFDNIRHALHLARSRPDPTRTSELLAGLAVFLVFRVSWEASTWFHDHATHLVAQPSGDAQLDRMVTGAAAWCSWIAGDLDRAAQLLAPMLPAKTGEDGLQPLVATAVVQMYRNDDAAISTMERALATAEAADNRWTCAFLLGTMAITHAYRGDREQADSELERQRAMARTLDNPSMTAWGLYCAAEVCSNTNPETSVTLAREAQAAAGKVGATMIESIAQITAITVAARHAPTPALMEEFGAVIGRCLADGAWTHLVVVVRNLIEALAALGEGEAAITLLHAEIDSSTAPYGQQAARLAALRADLRSQVDRKTFDDAVLRGRSLSREGYAREALAIATSLGSAHGAAVRP